jgi:hypothetical protein
MKYYGLPTLLLAMVSLTHGIPTNDTLVKRNAWSLYLFKENGCNNANSQGGYSDYGSKDCTVIFSDSVDFDPQGCTAIIYLDPFCNQAVMALQDTEQCFDVEDNPVEGALQGFTVSC